MNIDENTNFEKMYAMESQNDPYTYTERGSFYSGFYVDWLIGIIQELNNENKLMQSALTEISTFDASAKNGYLDEWDSRLYMKFRQNPSHPIKNFIIYSYYIN